MVDDNICYVEQCAKPGRRVILYSNENTPWNHYPIENEKERGIVRASSWTKIAKEIDRYASGA